MLMSEYHYTAFLVTDICYFKGNTWQTCFWPLVFTLAIELLRVIILWQISISQRAQDSIRRFLWKTKSTFGLETGMISHRSTTVWRNCGRPPTSMCSSAGWGCERVTYFVWECVMVIHDAIVSVCKRTMLWYVINKCLWHVKSVKF